MDENKKKYELSGPEKTGAFIKLLRVSHNLTQEELGDMVYVTISPLFSFIPGYISSRFVVEFSPWTSL